MKSLKQYPAPQAVPGKMIARASRHYTVAVIILIVFFTSVQIFRCPPSVDAVSFLPARWQSWLPSFSIPQVDIGPESGYIEHDQPPTTNTVAATILATQSPAPPNFDPVQEVFSVPTKMRYRSSGPKPPEIIILTATDGQGHNGGIDNIVDLALENRREYCQARGYINHFINITKYNLPHEAHSVWKKLPAIVEAFESHPQAQWLWWLDLDAIIMTPTVKLEERLLSEAAMKRELLRGEQYQAHGSRKLDMFSSDKPDWRDIDLLIAQDHNGLNAGSFFLRRSHWTQWLIDVWRDPVFMDMQQWAGREQDALFHLVSEHPSVREHVGLVGQRALNSYTIDHDSMGWHEGDLVVHLAGCWVNGEGACAADWERMWAQRGRVGQRVGTSGRGEVDGKIGQEAKPNGGGHSDSR